MRLGSSPKEKEGKDEGLRPIVEETGQSHRLLGEGKACLGGTILGHQLHRKGRGERQGACCSLKADHLCQCLSATLGPAMGPCVDCGRQGPGGREESAEVSG